MLRNLIEGWQNSGQSDALLSVFRTLSGFAQRNLNSAHTLLQEMVSEDQINRYSDFLQNQSDEWSELVQSLLSIEGLPHANWVLVLKRMPLGVPRAKLQNVLKAAHIDMTELYLDALESEEEGIVLDAVNSLGDIGSPAAIEGILRQLSSVLSSVRAAALSALQGRYHDDQCESRC